MSSDEDINTTNDDDSDNSNLPIEAVIFLAVVLFSVILLIIFFLYLNKSLCFSECGGFPCIDKVPQKDSNALDDESDEFDEVLPTRTGNPPSDNDRRSRSRSGRSHVTAVDGSDVHDGNGTAAQDGGAAYQYEESSSDSEDDVQRHYQNSVARANSVRSGKSSRTKQTASSRHNSSDALRSRGSREDVEAGEAGSYNAESDEELHRSRNHLPASTPNSQSATGASLTFENQAFMADASQGVAAAGSGSASDRAQSTERLTSDEHLFDVSDLQQDGGLISKCGSLEVSFFYDSINGRVVVKIHQARDIPAKDRGGANTTQVRIMLLPGKKQRHKSKIKDGQNPVFEEKIYFNRINPDEVQGMGLRFRLYGVERMRRERMIGESIVGFASLNLENETSHWVVLEPRSNLSHGDSAMDVSSLSRSDSGSSNQSLQHGGMPELLLGLAYNGTTGRLGVEVIKGSNFRNMAMNRAPDTYVKLSLMNKAGSEVQRCKTSVRRGQPNPLFKETFMLQVALFQLAEVTLMISVYNKKSMKKKEMVGWFSMGMNSSGEEENSHWLDMRESKGEQVCRWHILLES